MSGVAIEDLVDRPDAPTQRVPDGWLDNLALLLETQVVAVRHDAVRARTAVLLECRQALQVREGNTALVVVRGVSELSWGERGRAAPRTAWSVVGGGVDHGQGSVSLSVVTAPSARLVVTGAAAVLRVIEVEGLDEAPVDYAEDDAVVRAGSPSWRSRGRLVLSYDL